MKRFALVCGGVWLGALALAPSPAWGQSITAGRVSGRVFDSVGTPLRGAGVVLVDVRTGLARRVRAGRDGAFRYSLIPAGEYEVFVEELGFRPKRVIGVQVRPGGEAELFVDLAEAPPPINTVDTLRYGDAGFAGSRAGMDQWFSDLSLERLPGERREMGEVVRLSSQASSDLGVEGLPDRVNGLFVDGVQFQPARHPVLSLGPSASAAFPLSELAGIDLLTNPVDVEWSGASGGAVSGHARRGGGRFRVRAFGDWSGDPVAGSDHFDPDDLTFSSVRSGMVVSGPVIADSAQFVVGGEFRRVERPLPRPWVAGPLDEALFAAGRTALGDGFDRYAAPRVVQGEVFSGFGRLDWQVSGSHALSVRSSFASERIEDFAPPRGFAASLGSTLDAVDFSAAATIASRFTSWLSQELRIGVETSERQYASVAPPGTVIVDGGLQFGNDPALPGDFQSTAFRASEALSFHVGPHTLKVGTAVTSVTQDDTYGHGRSGEFFFADVSALQSSDGAFVQSVGSLPAADFTSFQLGWFIQNTWRPIPDFELTAGVRVEFEHLPIDDVPFNSAWFARTGLANIDVDDWQTKWSPRGGFVIRRDAWEVRGSAGMYYGMVEPWALGELVSHSGGVAVRRGVGALGSWPALPDQTIAPVLGPRLTLLNPDVKAPRSGRVSLGITRAVGPESAIHLYGSYRHTDFLLRRQDLNRLPGPTASDQYGRLLYGNLLKRGTVLVAEPGSNRRFSDFDLVSALNPDGSSDYLGATVLFERHFGPTARFSASYTFSRTTDNVLYAGANRGGPDDQLSPFPDGLGTQDWTDSRSDFDIPHRVAVGMEVRPLASADVTVAGFYRFRSGEPFTPGFRPGVDANGDGSLRNDPAFIDDQVAGLADVLGRWKCLRSQVGRFAKRNSCRLPGIHTLDVGVGIGWLRLPNVRSSLILEGLNLLESDHPIPDQAVYLVDGAAALGTDPASGTVTVPLVANPNFGETLAHWTSGRTFRFGLRVEF